MSRGSSPCTSSGQRRVDAARAQHLRGLAHVAVAREQQKHAAARRFDRDRPSRLRRAPKCSGAVFVRRGKVGRDRRAPPAARSRTGDGRSPVRGSTSIWSRPSRAGENRTGRRPRASRSSRSSSSRAGTDPRAGSARDRAAPMRHCVRLGAARARRASIQRTRRFAAAGIERARSASPTRCEPPRHARASRSAAAPPLRRGACRSRGARAPSAVRRRAARSRATGRRARREARRARPDASSNASVRRTLARRLSLFGEQRRRAGRTAAPLVARASATAGVSRALHEIEARHAEQVVAPRRAARMSAGEQSLAAARRGERTDAEATRRDTFEPRCAAGRVLEVMAFVDHEPRVRRAAPRTRSSSATRDAPRCPTSADDGSRRRRRPAPLPSAP